MSDALGNLKSALDLITNPLGPLVESGFRSYGQHQMNRTNVTGRGVSPDTDRYEPTWAERFTMGGNEARKAVDAKAKKELNKKFGSQDPYLKPTLVDESGRTLSADTVAASKEKLQGIQSMAEKAGVDIMDIYTPEQVQSATLTGARSKIKKQALVDEEAADSRSTLRDLNKELITKGVKLDKNGSLVPLGSPERGQVRQGQRADLGGKSVDEFLTDYEGNKTYGSNYDPSLGTSGNEQAAAIRLLEAQNDTNFNSKQSRYERYRNQESDRRSDYRFDLNRADKLAAQGAEIDLAKMKMEHQLDLVNRQHEMDMEQYQQGMLGNLLGGLFSLGSLL